MSRAGTLGSAYALEHGATDIVADQAVVQMHPRVSALDMVAAQKRSASASCRSAVWAHVEHPTTPEAFGSEVETEAAAEGAGEVEAVIAET